MSSRFRDTAFCLGVQHGGVCGEAKMLLPSRLPQRCQLRALPLLYIPKGEAFFLSAT